MRAEHCAGVNLYESHTSQRSGRPGIATTRRSSQASARTGAGAGTHCGQRGEFHRHLLPHRAVQVRYSYRHRQRGGGHGGIHRRRRHRSRRRGSRGLCDGARFLRGVRLGPGGAVGQDSRGRKLRNRGRRHAARHDRALSDPLHVSAQGRRYLPGPRRCRRSGWTDRADGQDRSERASSARYRRRRRRRSRASPAPTRPFCTRSRNSTWRRSA